MQKWSEVEFRRFSVGFTAAADKVADALLTSSWLLPWDMTHDISTELGLSTRRTARSTSAGSTSYQAALFHKETSSRGGTVAFSNPHHLCLRHKMINYCATASLLLACLASASPTRSAVEKRSVLDAFVASERDIAVAGILANIGSNGALAAGASRGVVIGMRCASVLQSELRLELTIPCLAAPGTVNPDYR